MTQDGAGGTPLTPEEDAAVARLLADAAEPVTMPADVADRLDGVLRQLAVERSPEDLAAPVAEGSVTPLASPRRWPRLLLAAAAVVVAGYAVGSVATEGTLSGSDGGGAGSSDSADSAVAGSAESLADEDAGEEPVTKAKERQSLATQSAPESSSSGNGSADEVEAPLRLSSDALYRGARQVLRVLATLPTDGTLDETDAVRRLRCPPPELAEGERALPVRYDERRAVVVAGVEEDGLVPVTVYSCDGTVLDSTDVRP